MTMKLIKLKNDHYVVVADSEIKEGDWYYWEITKTIQIAKLDSLNRLPKNSDGSKKITHSTQPFNNRPHFAQYGLITLSEVKELLGEVDVEKKAEKFIGCKYEDIEDSIDQIGYDSFIRGYNQALEDNKEKKYTEEDIRKVILVEMARKYLSDVAAFEIDEIIQSLQPKTEWEVEFIDGKLKLK